MGHVEEKWCIDQPLYDGPNGKAPILTGFFQETVTVQNIRRFKTDVSTAVVVFHLDFEPQII